MDNRRRRNTLELGLGLLFYQMSVFGFSKIPPVTLITILGQAALYMGLINVPWAKEDVCISVQTVLVQKDYRRLILSALEHGDDMHLYYNMVSFMLKGYSLEKRYGSKNFGIILTFLLCLQSVMYVAIGQGLANVTGSSDALKTCAIGFSGVLFALKVLTTYEEPQQRIPVVGIPLPGKYAPWAELILIHLMVPNASFVGHLGGILAGLVYTSTYIGTLLDYIAALLTGVAVVHGVNGEDANTYNRRNNGDYQDSGFHNANNGFYRPRDNGFFNAQEDQWRQYRRFQQHTYRSRWNT